MMTTPDENPPSETRRGVDRRTLIRASAWSIPVVMVATASPAAATQSGTMTATSGSIVERGNSNNYDLTLTFSGTSPGTHQAQVTGISAPPGVTWVNLGGLALKPIPAGGGSVSWKVSTLLGNPVGETVTVTYTVVGHGTSSIAVQVTG